MSRLLRLTLAILFILGIANVALADSIPEVQDPKNYPVVWTASVYNGSGSDITSGYIVDWDFDTSNSTALDGTWYDDMCPWVKVNATDEGIWTAGVVPYGKNIVNGDVGSIIIRGPAYVFTMTALTADTLAAADGSGRASPFDGGANDEAALGVVIKATTTNGPGGGQATVDWSVIFVDITRFDEN